MTPELINALAQKVKAAKNIGIFMHNNPDGDAAGSACGLLDLLQCNYGKTAQLIYPGRIPTTLNFIPHINQAVNVKDIPAATRFDLGIAVDTGVLSMLIDGTADLFLSARDTIKIDHHKDSENFANLNICSLKPAAGEVIYNIAQAAKWSISPTAATALYAAIISDTISFQYINASDTLKVGGALVDLGANPASIARDLAVTSKESAVANAKLVAAAEFFFGDTLALAMSTKDQSAALDGKGGMALSMLLNMQGVDYVALLKEVEPGVVRLSLRGKKPVNHIARELGGGGHPFAAATSLSQSLPQARETVLKAFEKALEKNR